MPKKKPEPSNKDRQIPKIGSWLSKNVFASAANAVQTALKDLRRPRGQERDERFEQIVHDRLLHSPFKDYAMRGDLRYQANVRESFGKPLLVTFDLLIPHSSTREGGGRLSHELLQDVLERVAQTVWHNPEVAPVAVRGRIITHADKDTDAGDPEAGGAKAGNAQTTILDMTDIGFPDEIARSAELYERFGSPAADPAFRP